MPYSVTVTAFPEQVIVYIRAPGPLAEIGERIGRLMTAVQGAGLQMVGPPMARYFEEDVSRPDLDYEVAVPVLPPQDGPLPETIGEARVGVIPAYEAVVTHHGGPYDEIHMGYTALTEELNALGYAVAGPATEIYLKGPESTDNPTEYVTELRLPVAR